MFRMKYVLKCLFFLFVFVSVSFSYSANNPLTLRYSPSYFIPNQSFNKKGTKIISENSETIAFVQTMKGRVQFTANGLFIGMLIPQSPMEHIDKTPEEMLKEKKMLPEDFIEPTGTKKKLVVMGIGFKDSKHKGTKSIQPYLKEPTGAKVNFFKGKEDEWQVNVPTYAKLIYPEVWQGIDIEYIGYMDKLEYRVIIKPEGDISSIIMSTGAEKLELTEEGNLKAELSGATLLMSKPYAYQIIEGQKVSIPVNYKLLSNGDYGFEVGDYDKSKELIIDPILSWSTYLGGDGDGYTEGIDVCIGQDGKIYVVGNTDSVAFPLLNDFYGVHGLYDVFLAEFSPDCSNLLRLIMIGGSDDDLVKNIVIDSNGDVVLSGVTKSSDFPTTNNSYSQNYTPGGFWEYDIFVTKIRLNDFSIHYSTYIGGSSDEKVEDLNVNSLGEVYIVGKTYSGDFPVTENAFSKKLSGSLDGFITKLTSDCSAIVFSSYFGGSETDGIYGIEIDSEGMLYVAGYTKSEDFPVTLGSYCTVYNGGYFDCFVSKLTPDGSSLVFSTFLGGTDLDYGIDIALDSDNFIYVLGGTYSDDFPVTEGAYFEYFYSCCFSDAFVCKLNPSGTDLVYSTFLSEFGGYIYPKKMKLDDEKNVYVVGSTSEEEFTTTSGVFSENYNGGDSDVFVVKLNSDGSSVYYSTFLGGLGYDKANSMDIDSSGNLIVVGRTDSSDFPVTANAFDRVFDGTYNCFISKFNFDGSSLIFSTFLGSRGGIDTGIDIDVDFWGNTYIVGYTKSPFFPTTIGAFDSYMEEPSLTDVFVSKIDVYSSELVYSTFIGGRGDDYGIAIKVDYLGYAYVTGNTNSIDFPVTHEAYDSFYNGGEDIFLCKLNNDGSSLVFSTFLGGANNDYVQDLEIDSERNIYIAGYTTSFDYPVTTDAYISEYPGTYYNAIISKLNNDGTSLMYSTFIGGKKSADKAYDIELDGNNNIYIAGYSNALPSSSINEDGFPVTEGVVGQLYKGNGDLFVAKLDTKNSVLEWSTLLGGTDYERNICLTLDSEGNVYLAGTTRSSDFPTTDSALSSTFTGSYDVFVTKLNPNATSILFSTYLSGCEWSSDNATYIGLDSVGNIYVIGYSECKEFPFVDEDSGNYIGWPDVFVCRLSSDGSAVKDSIVFGGVEYDIAKSFVFDKLQNGYVIGTTYGSNFPVTADAYDTTFGPTQDVFVSKLKFFTELPLPTVNILANSKNLTNLKSVKTTIINPTDEMVIIEIRCYDNNNNLISTTRKQVASFGKSEYYSDTETTCQYVSVYSDNPSLIMYSSIETATAKMSSYINNNLSNRVYIPHIAESTDWWDTNVFLLNKTPGNLNASISNNTYSLTTANFCTQLDMEAYMPLNAESSECWGSIESDTSNPERSGIGLTGFETFVRNETDGAAVELQNGAHKTLYIPHIPGETDIFWTGFSFVNPNEEEAHLTVSFYTSEGDNIGVGTLTIPGKSKIVDLMKNLFPDYYGRAEWGIIESDLPILGIEIYGTQKDGICGYSLPFFANNTAILPEVLVGEEEWSGIAISNVGDGEATVTIQLISRDGGIKAEKEEIIPAKCRFKAVVSDYFNEIDLEEGDYVRYISDGSLVGIVVNGDLSRTYMTALTGSY